MIDFLLAAGGLSLITYLAIRDKSGELEKLFKACKIQNVDKKIPKIIKQEETDYGKDVILYVPEGLSISDFEKKQEAIEQYLGAKIELENIGRQKILMKVMANKLKTMYPYRPIKTKEPVELPLGISLKGPITLKLDDSYPSCLVGGTSGSGKSVCLRVMITNCILTKDPKILKLHLCDLKYGVEFSIFKYSNMVETFAKNIDETLELLYMLDEEMHKRYELFSEKKVVNIQEYNRKYKKNQIPYHLVFIDEFANLHISKEAIDLVDKLLRMARAVGIHFVIATQRPDKDTVPGSIKANLQASIAFKTKNDVNSMILLDNNKASELRGKGHGILQVDEDIEFQGYFLDIDEARELIKHTYVKKKSKAKNDKKEVVGEVEDFGFLKMLVGGKK